MLGRLKPVQQARLVAAMESIETLLGGDAPAKSEKPRYILRRPKPGDFGWIVARHAELYAQEYGWVEPFEGLCAKIVADFANKNDPKRERCWIAELDGENVGSVMLVKDEQPGVARVRLLLVDPKARGLGLGAKLVDECVRFARERRLQENHALDPQRSQGRAPHLREGGLQTHRHRAAQKLGPRGHQRILGFGVVISLSPLAGRGKFTPSRSSISPRRICSSSRGRISTKLHGR